MEQQQATTALIIGASRGLGLGLTREYLKRGWKVIATERGHDSASALRTLASEMGQALQVEQLDINFPEQIQVLAQRLRGVSLELLFVNAGVIPANTEQTSSQISDEEFTRVMISNALSPIRVIDALQAQVTARGTIAVMSSTMGSVAGNTEGGNEIYRASKAALNSLMHSYAVRAGGDRCLVAMMPGWVQTDMGGAQAPVTIADSARGMADTLALHEGIAGLVFIDYQNRTVPW